MADNTTIDNGALTDYTVADEELSDGSKLQSVELHVESGGTKTKVGSGSPLHVQGTVTANLGAVDNAVLDAIAASVADVDTNTDGLEALLTTIDADTGNIATSVSNIDGDTSTIIAHLDGVEGLLTTIDVDTGNIATSVSNIDTDTTTIIGHLDGVETVLGTIDTSLNNIEAGVTVSALPNEGQQTMANSISVAIASNQSAVSVTDTNGAAIAASLSVLDDWDETDRAKVNIISGQAGITAGAGAVGASTPRVTHASDDPVTVAVQLIDDTVFVDDADFTDGTSKGIGIMAVAENTPTTVTDGDMGMLAMDPATRALKITSVDASGGGTSSTDGTAFNNDTTDGTPVMGAYQSTPDNLTDGDMGVVGLTIDRALRVNVDNSSAIGVIGIDGQAFNNDSTDAVPIMGVYQSVPENLTDGDLGVPGLTEDRALRVNVDNAGDIGGGPGGTSYTEGDTDASITGTAIMWEDGSDTLRAVSASNRLPVALSGNSTLAEQQSQTTHLATIAGDTTAIETAIQILDDWDESDRAKVNPIVGQAGVAAGSGGVGATTQRVVLANDTPGPTGSNALNIQGAAAHDAGVAGNPVLMGGRSSEDEPTAVSADGEAVSAWFDRTGRQVVLLGHADPEPPVIGNFTADGTIIAAPGASVSLYIKKGSIHNRSATEQVVALEDGSGGTERWRANLAADGGGSLFDFGERGWKLTANTLLALDCVSGSSPDIDVNITEYYIAP